nr:30K protein 22 [Bombyx mori]
MSAPIIPNSARDITRIVNERVGMVVIYGMPVESQGIKLLAAELKNKLLLYCPDYELSDYLQEPTMMDSHVAFLNKQLLVDLLVKYVSTGDYDKAVTTTKFLKDDNVGFVIEELIDRLLHARESNMFAYADKLWSAGHHDIVNDFFPSEVKLITKQERVKIIGRHYNQALKLDSHLDWYNDRLAWGDSKDKTSHRMSWKLIPVWENNKLLYKIMNTEHTMYLKLDKSVDGYGDRKAWGSNNSEEKRHLWKLTPVVLETGNVLLIENHEYGQGLKLDASVDWYGDRLLWGNNGNVNGNPSYFGWVIDAWQ